MKRGLFVVWLAVTSPVLAFDSEHQDVPGQCSGLEYWTKVTRSVDYIDQQGGQTVHITNAAGVSMGCSFQPPGSGLQSGTASCADFNVQATLYDTYGQTFNVDLRGYVGGVAILGGRIFTTRNMQGSQACPITGAGMITEHVTYTVGEVQTCEYQATIHIDRVCPGDATSHTIEVCEGASCGGEQAWTAGDLDLVSSGDVASGTVVTIKLDGQVVSTNTVTCYGDPPPTNAWEVTGSVGVDCEATPTPSPNPSPSATPPPTPPPEPSTPPAVTPAGPPPNPTINPAGGTPGNVTVTNPSDFYNPVKAALEQAESAVAPPPDNGNSGGSMGNGVVPAQEELDRGKLDSLEEEAQGMIDNKDNIIQSLTSTIQGFNSTLASFPTSCGSTSTLPFDLSSFNNIAPGLTLPSSISLSPWASSIAMLRTVLLWIVRMLFFIKVVQLFVSQGQGSQKTVEVD